MKTDGRDVDADAGGPKTSFGKKKKQVKSIITTLKITLFDIAHSPRSVLLTQNY